MQGYKTAIAKSSIILTNKNKALEQQKNALQFHSDTLQKLSNSKFDFMCEEEYSHEQQNYALRYAIKTKDISSLIKDYNDNIDKHIFISDTESFASSKKSSKSGKSNKSNKQAESKIELHPIEVLLVKKAVDYLGNNKCVVIDIFARNKDATIKFEDGLPETHAVVLYKNTDREIIVIDPTNSEYSRHLSSKNNMVKVFDNNQDIVFATPPRKVEIYTPVKENTGPGPSQYRDCIDIAVKLVFALNKHQEDLDIKNISVAQAIQEVTNSAKINGNLVIEGAAARIIQASDDDIRSDVHMLIMNMAKQIIMAGYSEELTSVVKNNIINTLQAKYPPEKYKTGVESLFNAFIVNSDNIRKEIDTWAVALQGELCTKDQEDL